MAASKKFEAPEISSDRTDTGKYEKLAVKVEKLLATKTLNSKGPLQIDPNHVLVSPLNRLGAAPNVRHVHQGILKGFKSTGFDNTRPKKGVCIKVESPAGIKALLEHNQRFTQNNQSMPAILTDHKGPWYASLACSHLNIALRCIKGGTSSPLGELQSLMKQESLHDAATNGHWWWILPEDLSKTDQADISLWRNQDQNENQAVHELEILGTMHHVAKALLAAGKSKVTGGDLIAASQKRTYFKKRR